ncbi:hypothetical protein C8A03DRAFT_36534 [Achaetomium macrosporum]|uniref:Nucleotide-diphospho-sugar transferase domain-containing protein n=1 Tax=Achaetomium macrosporum TaxID=79813 RepID=A0AAN7C561_9PEZI|nr:hypothetical protein C8A03DRAFT_36534 [Achaetomium macrosporum]
MALPALLPNTLHMLKICIPIVLVFLSLVYTLRIGSLAAPIQAIKNAASPGSRHGFSDIIYALYEPIKLPVTAQSYTDQRRTTFDNGGRDYWKKPMGKDLLIVEIDTRNPNGENEIFSARKLNWEAVTASGSGLLTVSHINHFIYSQIHGYDYKFFHARKMTDHWDTWIKPHALLEVLRDYKFVVFIDADAIIQHLEVPMEFLFNRWNIAPNTSVAMPIDTQQVMKDTQENISTDSKGKVVLNSGVVVLQNLPYTHDIMQAWAECTTEKRYPGCGKWKRRWSHEQRAFSEYIRYDFNPDGNNIVEIPCNDANGYPGLFPKAGIIDDCKGEFIRHYTLDKPAAKASTGDVLMQSMSELLQKNFATNQQNLLIKEPETETEA